MFYVLIIVSNFLLSQGYWMVKRAVGTKACLLGKAVTCKYLRQDNFLEVRSYLIWSCLFIGHWCNLYRILSKTVA